MKPHVLLEKSALPHQAVPFQQLRSEDFESLFEAAFGDARKALEKIGASTENPSFQNTIEALESCSEKLDLIAAVFSNLLSAETNEILQNLAQKVMPQLADFSNDVFQDLRLFQKVKAVWESEANPQFQGQRQTNPELRRERNPLSLEQKKLLEKTYRSFVRNGALLGESDKKRVREIDQQLAVLEQRFADHLLAATQAFQMVLTREEELQGLPDSVREAAAHAAIEKGLRKEDTKSESSQKTGGPWLFTLDYPSFAPFLKFSEVRELRERIWKASQKRATEGEWDNRPVLMEIARLRGERAKLLGYATHADFVLEERMAGAPARVHEFLNKIWKVAQPAAQKDLEELKLFAGLSDFRQWDYSLYSEKLKKQKFNFDEEALRAYFPLNQVIEGVFEHARRLYGLSFRERTDLPVYHSDVRVFEVMDREKDQFIGLFYTDFFPRSSKRGGAWMTTFLEQGWYQGEVVRPHVSIVCNLTKPTPTRPSLLTLDEVRTVFHEFGHALHALLSECHYRSLGGTHVYWDFVELPSQVMENWVLEKEALDLFARHYETGEKIPASWIKSIQDSSRFHAGTFALRQLSFGFLDLAWHANAEGGVNDPELHERKATAHCQLFEPLPGALISTSFSHVFSGGYAAGYYSYKWAEVLDADAFELFKEKGLFNAEVARRFRREILARGGTEHPMALYQRFRGREPDPDALFRREGLLAK